MKDGDTRTGHSNNFSEGLGQSPSSPRIAIDLVRYVHHLEGLPLTDEQKLVLLKSLNELALDFIAMGFRVHPVQNACGQDAKSPENLPPSVDNEIDLAHHFFDGTRDKKSASSATPGGERAD